MDVVGVVGVEERKEGEGKPLWRVGRLFYTASSQR
jgi:hypothetical protein